MKRFLIACGLLFTIQYMTAQNIYTGNIEYNKIQQQGTMAEYNYPESMVNNVLMDEIEKVAGKSKSIKGYQLFKGVHVNAISPDIIDLYVKTERKSKKEKEKTIVYVLVSKGYDNFMQPGTDAAIFDNVKAFLQSITAKITATNVFKQIEEQEKVVKKEEKKLEAYQDDIRDMENKVKRLNNDIDGRKRDIEQQRLEISKQQAALQLLKDKKS